MRDDTASRSFVATPTSVPCWRATSCRRRRSCSCAVLAISIRKHRQSCYSECFPKVADELAAGAIVMVSPRHLRLRALPITPAQA